MGGGELDKMELYCQIEYRLAILYDDIMMK